jgi:UDP-N-acetylmuramyl tripeptide synthase
MANILIKSIKKVLGPTLSNVIAPTYHGLRGQLYSLALNQPAKKLYIIGITGTKGKTSTTIILGRLMNRFGLKTGYLSTALLNVKGGGIENEYQNPYKMTSIDSTLIQKRISEMVKNGCKYLVIELSSEGLKQNRHLGLGRLNLGIFLNLYPEHIESHGSLLNYMKAKAKMFDLVVSGGSVIGNGLKKYVKNQLIDNQEEKSQFMFSNLKPDIQKYILDPEKDYQIVTLEDMVEKEIIINGKIIKTNLSTIYESRNLVFALFALKLINEDVFNQIINLNESINQDILAIPGRMEWVIKHGELM